MNKSFFVTGIGTEIGKTVISALLVQALKADYWKPVQAGDLDFGDADKVKSWTDQTGNIFHPGSYLLNTPMSPHAAAERDGLVISMNEMKLPETTNHLIVEGAGGLMVPLNDGDCIIVSIL